MKIEPVLNKYGEIELYDIYIDGKWVGSRRTIEFCEFIFKEIKDERI